jgi:hypothetical protein
VRQVYTNGGKKQKARPGVGRPCGGPVKTFLFSPTLARCRRRGWGEAAVAARSKSYPPPPPPHTRTAGGRSVLSLSCSVATAAAASPSKPIMPVVMETRSSHSWVNLTLHALAHYNNISFTFCMQLFREIFSDARRLLLL